MQTKVKHTPGPWRVASWEYAGDDLNVDAKGRGFICLAGKRGDGEAEANARLIAAAPELLEGARQVVEWRDLIRQNYPDMAGLIRGMDDLAAAIAKAEGE